MDGAHTHHHGGGHGLVLIVVIVLIAAIGKAAKSAVSEAGHVLSVVLEVVLIAFVAAAVLAVLAALGWAGIRVYRWRAGRRAQPAPATVRAEVIPPGRAAIEPPKPHPSGAEDLVSAPRQSSPIIR